MIEDGPIRQTESVRSELIIVSHRWYYDEKDKFHLIRLKYFVSSQWACIRVKNILGITTIRSGGRSASSPWTKR